MWQAAAHLTEQHFRSVADLVQDHVGIRLPAAKRSMIEGRLQKRARALNYRSLDDYVEHLFDARNFDNELVHLIDSVTTNKTDFFREPSHFEFMQRVAVPELLSGRRGAPLRLKVWSAASSTGMEAYTIAMVLDDMVRRGGKFHFRILGTDISTNVLQQSKLAIYPREVIAPVPPEFRKRYFLSAKDKSRDEVRVVPELRATTHFMRMNLMDATYPVDRDVDIIFCRNVLIYFDKRVQQQVVKRLCSHLRPGGFLMVGHSESMVHDGTIGLRQVQPTIFRV
ncbi:chemotaxis protein CheR [Bradyrhizobium sp. U87765 SZCCT0131]|uniref:CheR family methyltransferase n=1 Tax=unclassified Bradyrhizobium TaxID=2631580 RepID=UPI001BA57045|nr:MULTISPECIES: CheR family methyltransferase [unclassified Bradyrhizobium]MBR1218861.1 chemotaxis protein CheR [Bradyrhizobium sp. U87765 SZCCT0131]MBR1261512.1 chemotaxis protein CheR [Bradyrhizobium sp. U87765 SZCCT0134]MBR1306635.1 chemotaxis protein CheR [Bradyrhizobium sp. U87765 SZCCT0110]MBR1317294.1 chemotaxis protein CheR [Bradyrhizobium sp. U87765 SZCCT0109]MBR1350996.1 chemotaxis protein CheR [Bradyrhizobium sp. U87765 SZCCT0048]